jgi:hypothetical protein
MCGKAAVSHLSWAEIYAYASSLAPPKALPADPESRINISPSRLRRKSEPDSMVWETLPAIHRTEHEDSPADAIWPFIPCYVPPSFRPSGLKYPPVRQGPMTNIPL